MDILIVEPSRLQQAILSAMFTDNGIYSECVANIEQAKEALKTQDFDMVFAAFNLPDGKGGDIARYIKSEGWDHPKVVMQTTEENREVLNDALAAGVVRIIFRSNIAELETFVKELQESKFDTKRYSGRVLMIEEESTTSLLVSTRIEESGSTCDIVESCEVAMKTFSEKAYDLVVAEYDWDQQVNALDLVKFVRAFDGKKQRTPILITSEKKSPEQRIEILKCGANDYVSKPVSEEELAIRAQNLVSQKKLLDQVELQRERLRDMAMTDQLTSLYNRHFLVHIAPKRMAEARRHKSELGLIMLDLDHFKSINDTHGHDIGDQVLREVAGMLKQSCREEDVAIRLGGEEFLLLMPHCNEDGVQSKAESLRKKLESLKPAHLEVTGSFGATCLKECDDIEFSDLFVLADEAAYEAKKSGRNRVVYHPVSVPLNS